MADVLTEVRFWSMVGELARRTIICSPENESRVKGYIAARGLEGMFPVKVSPYVGDVHILVVDEGALQAATNEMFAKPIRVR